MTITTRTTPGFLITAMTGAALLAATALAPVLATPANAAAPSSTRSEHHARADHRVVHHDARRDVVRVDLASGTSRPAPRERDTDITRTVVDHRAHRLVVRAKPRHVSRSGYRFMVAEILAPDRRRFTLTVDYSTTPIDSRVSLERFASGRSVKCAQLSWSIRRQARLVVASVPTACLGDPRWVRVGVALTAATRNLKTAWADDSRARGRIGDRHLKLGPRQHKG
jgi:hypothetical protein